MLILNNDLITYPVALNRRGADKSLTMFLNFSNSVTALMASHTCSPVYSLSDHFSPDDSVGRPLSCAIHSTLKECF